MNYHSIMEMMCSIIEKQNYIIQKQAEVLAQAGAACMEDETREVESMIVSFLGE